MRACYGHRVSIVTALLVLGCGLAVHGEVGPAEITTRRVFHEPLVPVGARPSRADNEALAKALDAYVARGSSRAVEPLVTFLGTHPDTPWKASLLANLGWVYRQEGYLGRAEKSWREAWRLSKGAKEGPELAVAHWSVGNLADFLSQAGKREELAALMKEIQGPPVSGTAGSHLLAAIQQLRAMEQDPSHTLRCGPEALGALATALGNTGGLDHVEGKLATRQGTNLAQLQAWGLEMGMDLAGIELAPGAPIPVPALAQWKAGHFATITREEGGRFLVRNFLGGEDKWIAKAVLEEEIGSFALVPRAMAAKRVWHEASESSLSRIWGAGTTSGPDKNGPNKDHEKTPNCQGSPQKMATYSIYVTQASLLVEDIPLWYTPPVGPPVSFHVYFNQWDLQQPQTFTFWNFGPKWTMDWLSYVKDDPANPGVGTSIYLRGGGVYDYSGYNSGTGAFAPQYYGHDVLVRTSSASYERRLPDGSKEVFSAPDGAVAPRRIFLTRIIDPSGNALTFTYDAQGRLTSAIDALGQITTVQYELTADPLKVTKVIDPFGRTATFRYDDSKQLMSITDMGGISSGFTYAFSRTGEWLPTAGLSQMSSTGSVGEVGGTGTVVTDFLSTLVTPYGQTNFSGGVNGVDRFIQATDPLGQTERAEYHNFTGSMPVSDPVGPPGFYNYYLYYRNTFYWDKRAMASGAGDWTQARIYHFLHSGQYSGYSSPLLESTKAPLENRVWYWYGGAGATYSEGSGSQPTTTSRVLDDGTTQTRLAQYNPQGRITKSTDAAGRVTTYVYSTDGLDLLEVRNTTGTANELLARNTYNTQHRPLTITDAAGQTTTLTYNGAGQVQTITNPKNETTTFAYTPSQGGYLTTITGALPGSTTGFTYDAFGRVQTVIASDGATVTTEYDNLDRPTKITYSDGTTEVMTYDKLDLASKKDRQGRWTAFRYDPLRHLTEVQDPAGRVTRLDWCSCGSLEQLTDPLGHITNWWRDLQGRVIGKELSDGTTTNYNYDSSGRLVKRVDAKGQVTQYQYFVDDNLMQASYSGAQKPTPPVSYAYDPKYNRLATMADQFGTTTYSYGPVTTPPALGAGRLSSVTGPFANSTITYSYDELGRVLGRGINGIGETRAFDALGRVGSVTNPLGAFQYAYQGMTGRLDSIQLPNGQKTEFTYFDAAQDFRLRGIQNTKSDTSVISAFAYTYNADGTIQTWSQQADAQVPKVYSFAYDAASQLISASLNQGLPAGALIHQYAYGYDLAGNRTSELVDGTETTADYNPANQLTSSRTSASTALSVQTLKGAGARGSRPAQAPARRSPNMPRRIDRTPPKATQAGPAPSR